MVYSKIFFYQQILKYANFNLFQSLVQIRVCSELQGECAGAKRSGMERQNEEKNVGPTV